MWPAAPTSLDEAGMPAGVLQLQSRQHWDEDAPLESMCLAIRLLLPCDCQTP
jgi:hypothetical protein